MKKLIFFLVSTAVMQSTVSAENITISVNDAEQASVQDIIVYLTPVSSETPLPANTNQLVVDQQGKMFAPYIAVTQKGQSVSFKNKDDITHHIYSVSGKNNFEFKIQAGQLKETKQLEEAEEVAMGCNIHDWMSGYVLVVDTPYYTKTDAQGVAQIDVATAGEYLLTVWHPQLDTANNRVERTVNIDFSLKNSRHLSVALPTVLLPIPSQENADDFDFLDEY